MRHNPVVGISGVVVDLQEAVLQIRSQALQAGQRIPDGRRQRGLGGDLRQLRLQPALQIVEARPGLGPADRDAPVGRLPAGFLFDGVERGDPFERLGGDRRALGGMDIEELRIKSGAGLRRTCARQAISRTGPARASLPNPA